MTKRIIEATTAGGRRSWRALVPVAVVGLLTAGCDLEVFSPSTVDEATLDTHNSIEALWSGAMGQVSHIGPGQAGVGGFFTFGALRTDEMVHSGHPNGSTSNFGPLPHLRAYSDGAPIDPNWEPVDQLWNQSMMTRYVADFGVERSRQIYESFKDDPVAAVRDKVTRDLIRMYAWAGVAYRVLGDHLCHAVIDGGPAQPREVFYERGLALVTEGIQFAEENQVLDVDEIGVTAAYAVRAQLNMLLGHWNAVEADAAQVPTAYSGLRTEHTTTEPADRQRQYMFWLNYTEDRHMTPWGTPFLEWGWNVAQSAGYRNDFRAPYRWIRTNANPHREFGTDDRRPFYRKDLPGGAGYTTTGAAVAISLGKGTEMRIIEAEAALRRGDIAGMTAKLNELRTWYNASPGGHFERDGRPLPMLDEPESMEEAWAVLMRDRGVDLWMEGRRLADIRRWAVDPGFVPTTVVREAAGGVGVPPSEDVRRNVLDIPGEFCMPIGATERRLNPNL
jgi:starch-binding outer membrane protein, SusD/RagB family